jgi:glutathione S-transferase kappa 1
MSGVVSICKFVPSLRLTLIGNKPPWTLEAKAKYSAYDGPRAARYFGLEPLKAPSFFPIMSLLPLRCMLFIKDNFDNERYELQFVELWQCYWREAMDISKPDHMKKCLGRHFNEDEIAKIMEGGTSPKYKKMLTDQTAMVVAKNAFGAPWYCVTNKQGKEEPFFGSDRFHYMLDFLQVPYEDIRILGKNQAKL